MSRDFSKPYTPEELDGILKIFQSLPTYNTGGWISASDIPELIQKMGYPRTAEQVMAYQTFWEEKCNGKVHTEDFIRTASQLHDTPEFAREYAFKLDVKNDGFIASSDFGHLVELISTHDPKLRLPVEHSLHSTAVTVKKAGKVSIDHCVEWIKENSSAQSEQ